MERVLCIGAHCDDESFGCLGTLLKHKEAGDSFFFLWFTHGRDEQQFNGSLKVANYFGSYRESYMNYPDQELDQVKFKELVYVVETEIEMNKPTIVYCPFIGDLNKDHRLVSEATMVACRSYKKNPPKELWMYAISGNTELGFRPFKRDKSMKIDCKNKEELIRLWYPNEMINGREKIEEWEHFEKWPR